MLKKRSPGEIKNRLINNEAQPEALGVRERAQSIGVSAGTLYSAIAREQLRAVKCGRRTLILQRDWLSWLESLPQKSGASHEHEQLARQRWAAQREAQAV